MEETDGFDEGEQAVRPGSSEVSHLPRTVIWPCDVEGSLDEDGTIQVENYILDDVSIPSPPPDALLGINPIAL